MKLDFGCGENKHDGFLGIDKMNHDCVDIVQDLDEYPWPFKKSSIDKIIAYNVLEHLKSPFSAVKEMIRISKGNATWKVRFPVPKHPNAWKDLEHKYTLKPNWFEQFEEITLINVDKHFRFPKLVKIGEIVSTLTGYGRLGPDEYRIKLRIEHD